MACPYAPEECWGRLGPSEAKGAPGVGEVLCLWAQDWGVCVRVLWTPGVPAGLAVSQHEVLPCENHLASLLRPAREARQRAEDEPAEAEGYAFACGLWAGGMAVRRFGGEGIGTGLGCQPYDNPLGVS